MQKLIILALLAAALVAYTEGAGQAAPASVYDSSDGGPPGDPPPDPPGFDLRNSGHGSSGGGGSGSGQDGGGAGAGEPDGPGDPSSPPQGGPCKEGCTDPHTGECICEQMPQVLGGSGNEEAHLRKAQLMQVGNMETELFLDTRLTYILIIIAALVVAFLLREVNLWYWKINTIVNLLTEIRDALATANPGAEKKQAGADDF